MTSCWKWRVIRHQPRCTTSVWGAYTSGNGYRTVFCFKDVKHFCAALHQLPVAAELYGKWEGKLNSDENQRLLLHRSLTAISTAALIRFSLAAHAATAQAATAPAATAAGHPTVMKACRLQGVRSEDEGFFAAGTYRSTLLSSLLKVNKYTFKID